MPDFNAPLIPFNSLISSRLHKRAFAIVKPQSMTKSAKTSQSIANVMFARQDLNSVFPTSAIGRFMDHAQVTLAMVFATVI